MRHNWEIKKLGEVCEFVRGPFGGSLKKNIFKSEGYAVYEQKHAIYDQFDDVRYFIDEKKFNEMKRFELNPGDLIMSCSGTMGKMAIVPEHIMKGIINQALLKLTPSKKISIVFLKLWMESGSFQESLKEYSQGAAIQNVASVKILKEIKMPVPSMNEQRRIVAILDKAFAAIARAKENAEKNLANARELFESYLQGVFPSAPLRERSARSLSGAETSGWEEKTLGEVAEVFSGFSFKSEHFKKAGKYQVIRMGNVRPGLIRAGESPVFIDKIDEKSLLRSLLQKEDIIITQTGTRKKRDYGYTVAIDKDNYLLNQRIAAIRFPKNYKYRFFLYFSWSDKFRDQFFANETGTVGQGNVGIGAVTGALIPVPKLKEQHRIVTQLDALSAETKHLESIYKQKIAALDELKKSILARAFRGELP